MKKSKINWSKLKNEQDKEYLMKRIDRLMRVKLLINEELFNLNVDLCQIENRGRRAEKD